ncbi:UDP-glucoronosyl and UDP-glucosyl transferase [Dictyocaulus viviparus]|uniref:UDP-glucuronosyltransferase n=1 Tax=Dictyocaulus viviparus TaxID=29172 RepID=A0A0D8XXR8_DICVI|nr:UDP-glucoronosyl and UDP-glucosyl transferase [Dictyocaulus viviparus]
MPFIVEFLLISLCSSSYALNILVWSSTMGQSHNNFLGNIADILEADGHNVTLLMVEFDPDFKNSTGTRLVKHVMRYTSPYYDPADWRTLTFKQGRVFNVKVGLNLVDFINIQIFAYRICKGIINDPTLIQTLHESRFDIGIYEMFHYCPAGVMELAGIPKTMLVSSMGIGYHHYRILGMEKQSSFVPASLTNSGSRMNFFDRLSNVITNGLSWVFANICEHFEQALFRNKFPEFPSLLNLIRERTDYFLMNTNEFTESTRPTLRSIHYIGGSAIANPIPLSDVYEKIVSKSIKGVILFSLGSLVKSSQMPVAVRQAFIDAFRSFMDYVIIWKDDELKNTTIANIHFYSWIPQVDLLADGRVKLFITHGGMNSIQEALLFGVPMITLPLFGDQDSNAAVAAERGFSITLNKLALTREIIIDAINTILGRGGGESVYTQRVRQAARLLKGSPQEMRQTIKKLARVSATEPLLSHLKLDIHHLNDLQYYNIDVYLSIFTIFSFITLSYWSFKQLVLCLFVSPKYD